ncbi:hypothetical protein [uncultured Megamonas sp.]|uniref:hypothetical protein n=1 Tax=uncultured Megamonas sp. TaxID=286140 RepID=UPI00266EAFF1|nr:hypothetical protein [uncultured Megamonas sp.]
MASILSEKSQNPGELTIFKICIGFGISMKQFYSSKLFDLENIDVEKVYKF